MTPPHLKNNLFLLLISWQYIQRGIWIGDPLLVFHTATKQEKLRIFPKYSSSELNLL
jgi:hypothetical protein